MAIPSIYRTLPTQGTPHGRELAAGMLRGKHLKNGLKEAAIEQLANVPEPWLQRLSEENVAYVALNSAETLADTDVLWSYSNDDLRSDALKAQPIIKDVVARVNRELDQEKSTLNEVSAAFLDHHRPEHIAEELMKTFEQQNLAFAVRVTRDLLPLTFLEGEMGVTDSDYSEFLTAEESDSKMFREVLTELNGPEVFADESRETLDPPSDFVIIPFKVRGGRKISPISEKSYSQITGQSVDLHDGIHIWDNRLIVLDDNAVALPGKNSGFHSVLLHETGHAIDYTAETVPGLNHRQTVDQMYQADLQAERAGHDRFTSRRAKDNSREYMAEAVEAYLTQKVDSPRDFNKSDNNHQVLKEKNPELFAYVDRLMQLGTDQLKKSAVSS